MNYSAATANVEVKANMQHSIAVGNSSVCMVILSIEEVIDFVFCE
jgi:hypothetical protein